MAALGTLFLNRLAAGGPHSSAHAVAVTAAALVVTSLAGALAGLLRRR